MKISRFLMTRNPALFLPLLFALPSCSWAGTPVLTRAYDNARTGANTSETTFTPAKVSLGLKKLYSLDFADDPRLEAQPLYVPDVPGTDGKRHNVLYVATMANNVFAFDGDTGKPFWTAPSSLGPAFLPMESFDKSG